MELLVSLAFIIAGTIWMGLLFAALFGKLVWMLIPFRRAGKWPGNGVEAEAIVLKMEPTGLYFNKQPQLRLQVQVQPDKGRNFVTEIDTILPVSVKTGGIIRVKYNPLNYRELFLLNVA